jgi:saccharopine dehydrogenase (NAD+, L-lysine forming)
LIKFVLDDLFKDQSDILERATIVKEGDLTSRFEYLRDYAEGKTEVTGINNNL